MQRNANGLARVHKGPEVKAAREYMGMSQNRFAAAIGTTAPTVARLEKQGTLRIKYMYAIQRAVALFDKEQEAITNSILTLSAPIARSVPVPPINPVTYYGGRVPGVSDEEYNTPLAETLASPPVVAAPVEKIPLTPQWVEFLRALSREKREDCYLAHPESDRLPEDK